MSEQLSVKFKANLDSSMGVLYKAEDGRMVIWGPASVEVVDKENDKITADALKEALPQLLRRQRLSLEHSDQLVGDIKEGFQTEEPVTVKIDGHEYTRTDFPTDVLTPEEDDVPGKGLYVAGEVWSDTQQARETQEKIEDGVIDSYSISGEAIKSSAQVKDGELVDEIKSIDLSAVTLCEEGMNQKAKFAVISKKSGDGKLGLHDLRDIAVESINKTMGQKEEESGEDGPDNATEAAVDKEDLKASFKEATEEVLESRDFATKDDVQEMVNEAVDQKEDDEDDEEMEAPEDDDDEEMKSPVAALEEKVDRILEQVDGMPDEEEMVDPDEIEDPDDDGEEEVDLDPEEDDEMPPEVEDKGDSVSLDTLKSELPEDLYRAVTEHMTDPDEGEVMASETAVEEEKEDEEGEDVSKSFEKQADNYVENVGPVSTAEIAKSYQEDGEEDGAQVNKGSDSSPGTLDAFYETVGGGHK